VRQLLHYLNRQKVLKLLKLEKQEVEHTAAVYCLSTQRTHDKHMEVFALEQAMKAQLELRDIALLFL
jgi:hypothetical protein